MTEDNDKSFFTYQIIIATLLKKNCGEMTVEVDDRLTEGDILHRVREVEGKTLIDLKLHEHTPKGIN